MPVIEWGDLTGKGHAVLLRRPLLLHLHYLSLLLFLAVCTQLLVSRPDEENITSYLQLIEKCLMHEVGGTVQGARGLVL